MPPTDFRTSTGSLQPATESPASAGRSDEKKIFKIRPSLVTPFVVYGVGTIILFAATMALLVTITNSDSLLVTLGLILVVCLLIGMLVLLVLGSVNRLRTSYTLTNLRLYIDKGVVKRSQVSIPLPTIKSITLRQGPLQKMVGIGNLTVQSQAVNGQENLTALVDVPQAAQARVRILSAGQR